VLLYVGTSLSLGGTRPAKSVFLALSSCWSVGLCFWHFRAVRRGAAPRLLHRLELIATNLAVTLLLAELSLRAYVAWGDNPTLLVSTTLDAHRLIPGHDYGDGLRGNRLGYPGRDVELEKRPGTRRIAALGDSFALGPAVPFADNYLTLLERRLPRSEVCNYGVSGAGPREYLAILRSDVWASQPDLILLSFFVGNDITEVLPAPRWLDPHQHTLYLLLERGWRLACERGRQTKEGEHHSPSRIGQAVLSRATFREIETRRLSVCLTPPSAALEKKWQRTFVCLEQIIAECRQREVPLSVVLIPDEFQVNPAVLAGAVQDAKAAPNSVELTLPQRRLLAFFGERNVPCLDLLPAFQKEPNSYAPCDTHWNVRGNRLAAQAISNWLSEPSTGLLAR
jgi:hypothetical protein